MRSANSAPGSTRDGASTIRQHGKPKKPVRLSNKFVAGLTGEEMWWDDDPKATGFGVRSYPGGGKSFFIDYRLNGRQRRYTIGPFPRWSAEAAREEAKKLRKEIDRGVDLAGDKRERRTAPTVQDLIDRYATPSKAIHARGSRRTTKRPRSASSLSLLKGRDGISGRSNRRHN